MTKSAPTQNLAGRGPETRTDDQHGQIKRRQLKASQQPDRDLARGSEGDTWRASGPR